ncbi:proteophosphoglycan 5 [Gigaspora margarita]|uniref:Proteophosphoglycan 5 n=1 Tax=Gigaspora margarita TaxID=4874 RepID=A0A8H4AR57_GIGMA|nr:proteophosphoglycan 5 [Gigaspora margarita]
MIEQFLATDLESNAEVMLITHDVIRGPIFERLTPIPYASHITKAVSKLVEKLKPYIVIHWRMEEGQELGDSGIQGILDKLVLKNADYFIAGPKKCTGSRFNSTYTYTIMEAREELFKNNETIENIIYRWQ